MIYEIKNKPYIKIENFFSEIEIQKGSMVPAKVFHKLYVSDVKKEDIKTFSNTEASIKSKERKTSKF